MRILTVTIGALTTAAALSLTGVATASASVEPPVSRQQCWDGGGMPILHICSGGIYDGRFIGDD